MFSPTAWGRLGLFFVFIFTFSKRLYWESTGRQRVYHPDVGFAFVNINMQRFSEAGGSPAANPESMKCICTYIYYLNDGLRLVVWRVISKKGEKRTMSEHGREKVQAALRWSLTSCNSVDLMLKLNSSNTNHEASEGIVKRTLLRPGSCWVCCACCWSQETGSCWHMWPRARDSTAKEHSYCGI